MDSLIDARIALTVESPLRVITEPISVAEAKDFCEIPDADYTKDILLQAYIMAARGAAETEQGRDLVEKSWDLTMDAFPDGCIATRDNLSEVTLFRYRDSDGAYHTLTEDVDFIVDTSKSEVMPVYGGSWPSFTPWPSSAVLLRYVVSPPAVAPEVLMGMKFLISMWYANRIPVTEAASAVQRFPFCLDLLKHGRREAV